MDKEANGQTDKWTDRQMVKHTNEQTDKWINRNVNKDTDQHKNEKKTYQCSSSHY